MSPDSDVIGTNYDGTTAAKKRQPVRNRLPPRNCLYRGMGKPCHAGLFPASGPGRDDRAGRRQPVHRSCHRGFRPGCLFRRCNLASFVAHPDIYGPQFGGYDPIDLARGVTYAGNPRFWLISGERLYLFGREDNRDAFAADPQHYLRNAQQRWPDLEQQLSQ